MVGAAVFKDDSHTELLSTYMSHSLEAFLVITFVNSVDSWLAEWKFRLASSSCTALAKDGDEKEEAGGDAADAQAKKNDHDDADAKGAGKEPAKKKRKVVITVPRKYTFSAKGGVCTKDGLRRGLTCTTKLQGLLRGRGGMTWNRSLRNS